MSSELFMRFRPGQTSLVYEFLDPDTQFRFKAKNRTDLIRHIVNYRTQNRLEPIENLDMVLDHYLCQHPLNAGSCTHDLPLRRGLAATVKGGILLLKSMLYKNFVSQEEADRRANICVTCPHNVFPDKTRFVRWSDALAKACVGNRRAARHNDLGSCDVCTCPLRAKVHYGGELDLSEDELQKFPDFCWQKQEALKQKNG